MINVSAKNFSHVGNEEVVEDPEDGLIKDSVLEMAGSSFKELEYDVPLGDIRKNVSVIDEVKGKPISRDKYLEEQWATVHESTREESESISGSDHASESESVGDIESRESESEIEEDEMEEDVVPVKKIKPNDDHSISLYSASVKDVNADIEKGKAILNQNAIWENLLECRIKIQRSLNASNKLFQFKDFKEFEAKLTSEEKQIELKTFTVLLELLESLLQFQKSLVGSTSNKEDEVGNGKGSEDEAKEPTKGETKRNDKLFSYSEVLNKSLQALRDFQDPVIQKWNDKTRILSGKISNSDFSVFEQSTLKQIEQILCDKLKLIQRTQLKRTRYRILGKEEETPFFDEPGGVEELDKRKIPDEYDSEIFDDDDFYHKLLRDFIEKKASDVTDPHQLGRQWTELQKLRSKMKRKIDTRATKGRKLRFTVHNKMVNFMAPIPYVSWTDEAEAELFKSIFGGASTKPES